MKVAVILIDSKRKRLLLFLSLITLTLLFINNLFSFVFPFTGVVQCMTLSNFSDLPNYQQQLLSTERASAVGIKEAIVIPTYDPHKEAQRLYNEALQQFGATNMKTMKEVCGPWEQKGCSCSGSVEKTILNCRGQRINALMFDDFPETLIKL